MFTWYLFYLKIVKTFLKEILTASATCLVANLSLNFSAVSKSPKAMAWLIFPSSGHGGGGLWKNQCPQDHKQVAIF